MNVVNSSNAFVCLVGRSDNLIGDRDVVLADANHIVRACNAFEDLLAAAKQIVDAYGPAIGYTGEYVAMWAALERAIATAEGGK